MASSKLRTTLARSSNNFFPSNTNAHAEFLFKLLPNLAERYPESKFTFIPFYRHGRVSSIRYLFQLDNGQSFGVDLNVAENIEEKSSLSDILKKLDDVRFDKNYMFQATDRIENLITDLRVSTYLTILLINCDFRKNAQRPEANDLRTLTMLQSFYAKTKIARCLFLNQPGHIRINLVGSWISLTPRVESMW